EGDVRNLGADGQRAGGHQSVVGAGGRGGLVAAVATGARVAGAAGEHENSGGRDSGAEKQRTTVHGHSCVTGLAPGGNGFRTHLGMPPWRATTVGTAKAVTIGLRECAVVRGRLFTIRYFCSDFLRRTADPQICSELEIDGDAGCDD